MRDIRKLYIDGLWVDPVVPDDTQVIDPVSGEVSGVVSRGSIADVENAVVAARRAFESYSQTTREERIELLTRIKEGFEARYSEVVEAIIAELGAPLWLARDMQAGLPVAHLQVAIEVLKTFPFEETRGSTLIRREPIGVCALITPWNWPLHQIAAKVVPALATGCTMVLKPAELTPYSAILFAQILHDAGVPAGVFNLVNGRGKVIGAALSEHSDVDMVSFTGSTSAGIDVAQKAAVTVKRVCQELGGKSANILLDDVDFTNAITATVKGAMLNSGQTCSALTRLLVPMHRMEEVGRIAGVAAAELSVGLPADNPELGPLVSEGQWEAVQKWIQKGIDEGARLVAGGLGKPEGLEKGAFARPTVFVDVKPEMEIAREEIFGPVLVVVPYKDVDDAVSIANDSLYGLSGAVQSADATQAVAVAKRLRTGQVNVNGASVDFTAPFGGYKQSGNGREWGDFAFFEYIEVKAILGGA